MKTALIPKCVLVLLLPALFSACTFFKLLRSDKLKRPTFAFVKCEMKEADESRAKIGIYLSSYNPNAVGLKNVSVNYELLSEGKRFLRGDSIRIELPPLDTTRIIIPAEVVYAEAFRAAGPAAAKVMLGRATLPVRIDAVIYGNPTLYNAKETGSLIPFSLKVSRTEDIPIPKNDVDKAKDAAKRMLRKMF